jgi:glycosyltransferase involved in cell wall biosynthesis
LQGISDEFLERVYSVSACLIAASEGEGFGLPLIEAARHNLPIIARDISVFREVAGDYAFYFHGERGANLAEAVEEWLKLYEVGAHPKSEDMSWLTWEQSAAQVVCTLLGVDQEVS